MRISVPVFVLGVVLAWSSPSSALAEWDIANPLEAEDFEENTIDIKTSGDSDQDAGFVRVKLRRQKPDMTWQTVKDQLVPTTPSGLWFHNFGPQSAGTYRILLLTNGGTEKDRVNFTVSPPVE